MSGAKHRIKGNRVELEIVAALKKAGIHAERYPLSGASRFRGSGHDLDVYPVGKEEDAPLVGEVKARKEGAGFVLLEKWIADYDFLVTKSNYTRPLVTMPMSTFIQLLGGKSGNASAEESRASEPPEGPTP